MLMNRIKVIPHLLLEAPHPLMMLFSMSQEPPRWLSGTHHRLQLKQALQLKELKLNAFKNVRSRHACNELFESSRLVKIKVDQVHLKPFYLQEYNNKSSTMKNTHYNI